MTRFVVMTSSAKMPGSCWGQYARVAVVETDLPEGTPKMISDRARGMVRIVQTWERCSAPPGGKNTAFTRALAEARAMADHLNGGPNT